MRRVGPLLVLLLTFATALPSCKEKEPLESTPDAQVAAPPQPVAEPVDAGPPIPLTPAERLEQHRKEMADAADAGRYADVCKGTPWVNAIICNWAAAKAAGKTVERPNGELFRGYFGKEHWKHAYGRIVGDADKDGDYEVSVSGYNHHCVLDTTDTKYETKGAFNLWVQEQPEPREVTLNSGNTQQWVVLEEAELAKTLMDLAHAGGVEATAMAKNAMKLIAVYEPYTERKGELPTLPTRRWRLRPRLRRQRPRQEGAP
jgi:predicted small lipoprotein YifL